jgi:hypothetical protein
LAVGGSFAYVLTPQELVVVDLAQPLQPQVAARLELPDARAAMLQFRYLFVSSARGLEVVDVTQSRKPQWLRDSVVPLRQAAKLFVSRTFAYVANGAEGLAIVDITEPTRPKLNQSWNAAGAIVDARDVVEHQRVAVCLCRRWQRRSQSDSANKPGVSA